MYFSRLRLDARNRQVLRDLADCQRMHRTVMSAFPQASAGEVSARTQFGALYHVDASSNEDIVTVYVQSREKPDWSSLPPAYLVQSSEDNPACTSMDGYVRRLSDGAELVFRLRANATKKVDTKTRSDGRRRNGRRVELHRDQDLLNWLKRKAELGGFRVMAVGTVPDVLDSLAVNEPKAVAQTGGGKSKGTQGDGRTLTFGSVVFSGRLRITDIGRFRLALQQGIGSGKAYGFGLLLTTPLVT